MERDPNKSMIGSQFDTGSTVSGGTSEAVPSYAPIHSKKMAVKTITELCELSDVFLLLFFCFCLLLIRIIQRLPRSSLLAADLTAEMETMAQRDSMDNSFHLPILSHMAWVFLILIYCQRFL